MNKYTLGLFLISPFLLFLKTIRNFNSSNFFIPLFLISCYYSFQFTFDGRMTNSGLSDAQRYVDLFNQISEERPPFLSTIFSIITLENGEALDLYQFVINYVVSLFTTDTRWLFLVFGFIFTYFWLSNIRIVLRKVNHKKSLNIQFGALLLLFFLLLPIWQINGARFWTAANIFLYGILNFYLTENKNKIIWILIALFVHFGTLFFFITFVIYQIIPKKIFWIYSIYLVSTFFSQLYTFNVDQSFFERILPRTVHERTLSYADDKTLDNFISDFEKSSIHIKLHQNGLLVIFHFLVIYSFIFLKRNVFEKEVNDLWMSSIFFFSIIQFITSILNTQRLMPLVYFLILSVVLIKYKVIFNAMSTWLKVLFFSLVLIIVIIKIRFSMDFTTIWFFIGNPIFMFFETNLQPIIVDLKSIGH